MSTKSGGTDGGTDGGTELQPTTNLVLNQYPQVPPQYPQKERKGYCEIGTSKRQSKISTP